MKPRLALLALSLALSTAGARDPNNSPNPVSVAPGSLALEVFFPPTDQQHREFADVQKYLLNKSSPAFPLISGAVIRVEWSDFDLGDARTGTHTRYDFKIIDEEIGSWISAGKSVNFVLHTTPYGGSHCPRFGSGSNGAQDIGNCAMPPWMWTALGSSNYTDCGGQVPNYLSREFQTNYQAAIKALQLVQDSVSGTGYLLNTVNPETFSTPSGPGQYSPEGQSFVLLLEAAVSAWKSQNHQ